MSGAAEARAWGWRQGAGIFLLALLPRLAHWWFLRDTPLATDFVPDLLPYLFGTEKLVAGTYFLREPMLMSPGYSLFLAPFYVLAGPDVPLFSLVNALLDAGSAVLCAGLAARLAAPGRERLAGLAAGVLYALCGELVFSALLPLGEGPAMFCLLLGLTLFFVASEGDSALTPWLAGLLLALAALLRPNLAPALLSALALRGLTGRREPAVRGAVVRCVLGFFLLLLPFMVHNARVAGRASPFGFQGGFTLYSGNHPGASGVGDALPGYDNTPYNVLVQAWGQASEEAGRELTLAEADAWWYGRTARFFAENPAEGAGLIGRKTLLLLNRQGLDATVNQDFAARFSPVPDLLALPWGLVLALGAAGLCLRLGSDRRPEALPLALALFVAAGVVVAFQVTPRYRVVLLPLVLPFAGAGLADLARSLAAGWRGLLRRREACALAALGLVLGLSLLPLDTLVRKPGLAVQEHLRLARFYLLRGPQALAAAEFRAALALGAPEPERVRRELLAATLLAGASRPPAP